MAKTNRFHVKEFNDPNIVVEEEKRYRAPFTLFLIRNGKLIFGISLFLSVFVFLLGMATTLMNMKSSEKIEYESNGLEVSFDGSNRAKLDGTPITDETAEQVMDGSYSGQNNNIGVVIRIKEVKFDKGVIVFYSDNTALVKYSDGTYKRIYPVGNTYGIKEDGTIDKNAKVKEVTGEVKENKSLGITMLYLSDGSIEVTKDGVTFFVRNSDVTSLDDKFYTNLSMVSLPIKEEDGKTYYSNGTIKEGDHIIVDGTTYNKKSEKTIHDNIKIIYYDNGFAEVIKDGQSIIVEKSDHIVYDDYIFEIVPDTKDIDNDEVSKYVDIKNITLNNTEMTDMNYMIVLEETTNYAKYGIGKRLPNEYISYNVSINGSKVGTKVLDNNIYKTNKANGLNLKNNTYLIYEGKLAKVSEVNVKIGMWVNYERITNEYMNSAFIGTVRIYGESVK